MSLRPTTRAAALALVTAAATLALQILLHRLVSAKLVNNFAFFIISLTMLGFAFSGVLLSVWLDRVLADLREWTGRAAFLFPIAALGSLWLFNASHTGRFYTAYETDGQFVRAFFEWIPYGLLLALPFACAGLILGALLSAPELPSRRIYCFDLVGSALGACAVIPGITRLGVETCTLLACAALPAAALVLAPPTRLPSRLLALCAVAALLLGAGARDRLFEVYFPDGTILALTRSPQSGWVLEHVAWDPLARIEVTRLPPPRLEGQMFPSLLGGNRAFHARVRRILTQNNMAFTWAPDYDGSRESLAGIEETLYAAAYQAAAAPAPRVAIVGVGGGIDILAALWFGASDITAVEVNGATVGILQDTYRDYFRHSIADPRVHLVHDEGRHFLSQTGRQFDILQLSGVDSYSGTPGAAHVFSESYLYTDEAFDIYLSRLAENGILAVMRLEHRPPREMLRALVLATGALRRAGVEHPARHIVMLTAGGENLTMMLVKRSAFAPEEVQRLAAWSNRSPFFRLWAAPFVGGADNLYRAFLALDDAEAEDGFVAAYPYDIRPISDDRPFFFRFSYWGHLLSGRPASQAAVPTMEYSVLLLLGVGVLACLVCVYLPLRRFTARGIRTPQAWRWGTYFAAIGTGYMAAEIALLQKFGLFLGHPNYALSIVMAALLLTTGLGALTSAWIAGALREVRFVAYALAGVLFLEIFVALPRLPGLLTQPLAVRAAIVVALVAPVGMLLGVFLPTGLERLKPVAPAFAPWAWGINGIFSVLAPVASIAFSMTWGINALLLAAIPCYLVAGAVLPGARGAAAESRVAAPPSARAEQGSPAR